MSETQAGWNPQKSKTKANQAAVGAVQGGGILAALLVFARLAAPEVIPWPQEADPVLVTVMAGISGWARTFWKDKIKHGGAGKAGNGPLSPLGIGGLIILILAGSMMSAGCRSMVTEWPDGRVTREAVLDGDKALAIINLILVEGPAAAERIALVAERIKALDEDLEDVKDPDERAALELQRAQAIQALVMMLPPEVRGDFEANPEQIEALIAFVDEVKASLE